MHSLLMFMTLMCWECVTPIYFHHIHSSSRDLVKEIGGTPVCSQRYLIATCKSTDHCSTGKICIDTTYSPCCQPSSSDCPSTAQLGYQCNVKSPTNWCSSNDECRARKCCPTGCDYNVCI
ncbi:hypothetical protein KIN20_034933 [Parelaphostrongylus tenuis]|uniref:WAP domain-containing protein n=1 Tax=Parelaphostrongylus tenuis TaxID=148309 RepID=A0AAD5RB45_PARTN|nr:hypothetical protein KIN20_034933 [Parelaphostrongylus tenuis]